MKQFPEKKPTNQVDTPPKTDASLLPNEENPITNDDPTTAENTLPPSAELEVNATKEEEKGVTEEEEFTEDPEYLEILLSYTEEDLARMDTDPDEAEDQYTGYEMEE